MSLLRAAPATGSRLEPLAYLHEPAAAGTRQRIDQFIENRREDAALRVVLAGKAPSALPLLVPTLERHPHTTQTFLPMDAGPWLALVAPARADGTPDESDARAVLLDGHQGITYAAGTWHMELTVLERDAHFAVVIWRTGRQDDDEFATLSAPFEVSL